MGPGLGRTSRYSGFCRFMLLDCYEGASGSLMLMRLYALGHVGSVDKDALRDGDRLSLYIRWNDSYHIA